MKKMKDMNETSEIKKLKLQKNIGIIVGVLGALFFFDGIINAFGFYFLPFTLSPLLSVLLLAIGFWLTYKAEKDIKTIGKK